MKVQLLESVRKKHEAEMMAALCNISVYLEHSVGIGEHPDLVESVETQVARWKEAEEMISAVDKLLENFA